MKDFMKMYFGWLNLKDEEEVKWAINYLTQRGIYPSVWVSDLDASFFRYLAPDIKENEANYANTLDKMKRAHSSRARRQDPNKKPVLFHLSKSANKKLVALAKDRRKTKVAMVESLIEQMDELKRQYQNELQTQKEDLTRRFEAKASAVEKRAKESHLGGENEKLKVELATWKAKASRSENEKKAALVWLSELEVKTGLSHQGNISLTEEQEQKVRERYIMRLEPGKGIGQA